MNAEATWADLEALWAGVFELYTAWLAIGTLGAEVVDLALTAEDLLHRDPNAAAVVMSHAHKLLEDFGGPAVP